MLLEGKESSSCCMTWLAVTVCFCQVTAVGGMIKTQNVT